jgi:hypothetical protein
MNSKPLHSGSVSGFLSKTSGHLQALYQTLTGDSAPLDKENPHEGLQRFIQAHVEAEIEQAVGRLRSHIRPEEQLTFIFVGDYDLSFLGCLLSKSKLSIFAGKRAHLHRLPDGKSGRLSVTPR